MEQEVEEPYMMGRNKQEIRIGFLVKNEWGHLVYVKSQKRT